MWRRRIISLIGSVALSWFAGCAPVGIEGAPDLPASLNHLADGTVGPPRGWMGWCARSPDDCTADHAVVADSSPTRATIAAALAQVRDRMVPTQEPPGTDIWRLPSDGAGDCEDFALELRRELVQAGLPRGALKIAVARDPDGRLHAVLTVLTDGPTLVLDPVRQKDPQDWRASGLTFLALEEPMPGGTWLRVGKPY
jgi:predicted transglutaminase-like cysteine proteinase